MMRANASADVTAQGRQSELAAAGVHNPHRRPHLVGARECLGPNQLSLEATCNPNRGAQTSELGGDPVLNTLANQFFNVLDGHARILQRAASLRHDEPPLIGSRSEQLVPPSRWFRAAIQDLLVADSHLLTHGDRFRALPTAEPSAG
jgi:hypothetical protein